MEWKKLHLPELIVESAFDNKTIKIRWIWNEYLIETIYNAFQKPVTMVSNGVKVVKHTRHYHRVNINLKQYKKQPYI